MEPLGSRCTKFRFQPVEQADALARLQCIASAEHLNVDVEVLKFLIDFSEGDLRKAINLLQSAHRFISQQTNNQKLTLDFAHELTGFIPKNVVEQFLVTVSSNLDQASAQAASIIRAGYSATQFFSQLHCLIMGSYELKSIQKSLLANRFSTYEKRLLDGADAELQLLALAADISEYLSPQAKQVSII